MRLARYLLGDALHFGVFRGEGVVSLDDLQPPIGSIRSVVEGGEVELNRVRDFADKRPLSNTLMEIRLLAPIERPGKYLAIGMNYQKHMDEIERIGVPAPKQQLWFNKQTTCLAGPYDDIDPGVTQKLDYEAELGVVIGRVCKHVKVEDARNYVFGYFVANDVSARDWQFHSQTFTMGKSFDTHGPIGPWIVTADEVDDPHALGLRCYVNNELRQDSDTSQMIFNIWEQIAYLSTAFTLEPGDLIATGTPEGVGVSMEPPRFLEPGDVVRCEIDGVGAIENRVSLPSV